MPSHPLLQHVQPKLTLVDRPEISETFVDSLARVSFEGFNAKLEFVVVRMDDPNPPNPPAGRAVTASRIVIPLPGVVEMHAKLTQILDTLKAQGVIQPVSVPQGGGKPN
jgi:hypothetical protein